MRRILPVLLVLALSGCRTVSKAALDEARVAASVGGRVVDQWSSLPDAEKLEAVTKLTRAQWSVVNAVDGTPIPDRFAGTAPVRS